MCSGPTPVHPEQTPPTPPTVRSGPFRLCGDPGGGGGTSVRDDEEQQEPDSDEDAEQRELGLLRLQEVHQEAGGPGEAFKQAAEAGEGAGAGLEFLREEELCEPSGVDTDVMFQTAATTHRPCVSSPLGPVDVLRVPREPIQQQEDVGAARHPVTDPGALLQQPLLPHQLPTADARVQVLGLLFDQVGFGKEVGHAYGRDARSDRRERRPPDPPPPSLPGAPWHQ